MILCAQRPITYNDLTPFSLTIPQIKIRNVPVGFKHFVVHTSWVMSFWNVHRLYLIWDTWAYIGSNIKNKCVFVPVPNRQDIYGEWSCSYTHSAWRSVVTVTLRPLYTPEDSYMSRYGRRTFGDEEKNLVHAGNRSLVFQIEDSICSDWGTNMSVTERERVRTRVICFNIV
jgi:hypothetical protein